MQDDGNSVQQEAIDAVVLTAESAEAKRAKQRQKERYKKQYASPYYEKRQTTSNKSGSGIVERNSNQPKIKKSSISPAKSVQRFMIILIGSLLLVVLLFSITIFPILLPLTVLGEEEETETTEITEEVSTDEQETLEVS